MKEIGRRDCEVENGSQARKCPVGGGEVPLRRLMLAVTFSGC